MPKSSVPVLPDLGSMFDISLDTGWFNFAPIPPEDPKLAKLRELPFEAIPDRLEWTQKKRPFLIPGREFDTEHHQYLVDLYRCDAKEIVVMKSGQSGVSEYLITYAIHTCDQRNGNVLYVFPSDRTISDFSAARIGPAIEASEYLDQIIIDGSGSGGMSGSNRITLKRIRNSFLYLRGAKVDPDGTAEQLKSMAVDVLILDEVDELDQRAPEIAKKRLGHARRDLGNILWVSTPTFPGYGIDAEYGDSDRRQWHIRCDGCGERQPLSIDNIVIDWDEVGRPVAWHGQADNKAWLVCRHCAKPLDRLSQGEWVAEYPSVDRVGFHITKLFSPFSEPLSLVKALDTADEDKRREAFNQDLGLPYTPRGGNLTTEDLDACRRDYGHGPDPYKTCYMGIDVGSVLHVVVRTMPDFLTEETKQIYAGEANWQTIHNLVKIYKPRTIVVDANPETSKAREFQEAYTRNRVWVAYYPTQPLGNKKEDFSVWDLIETKVSIDRTRAMDEMFGGFYGRSSTLPAHARNIRDYYNQMRANIRITKEIGASGIKTATYIDNKKADHYAHAEVYCLVASLCKYGTGWTQGAAV